MFSGIFIKLVLSIIFGALIGLERESRKETSGSIGGMRTHALIGLAGALSGVFITGEFFLVGLLVICGFFLLLISYYAIGSWNTKDFGMTSELSAMLTFIIGVLLVVEVIPLQITVAVFVFLIFILSVKKLTDQLVAGVSREEMQSFISYAIIALVVLPVLPDKSYKLTDIPVLPDLLKGLNVDLGKFSSLDLINPQKIWMVVVLITGIDVFGYILSRIVGTKKGFALASFLAGFVSSTSTTQSLAQKSKNATFINHLVGAAVLANLASFLQIFLLVGPLNSKWLVSIAPSIFLMIITAAIITYYFFKQKEPKEVDDENAKEDPNKKKPVKIFSLMPALKFAGILIMVKIITKICLILFGQSGFIVSSVIASFAGIDAIIVTLAEMAGNTITFKFALLTFLLVNTTNLLSKSFYSYLQGKRSFALRFLISAMIIIAVSSLWLIFI